MRPLSTGRSVRLAAAVAVVAATVVAAARPLAGQQVTVQSDLPDQGFVDRREPFRITPDVPLAPDERLAVLVADQDVTVH